MTKEQLMKVNKGIEEIGLENVEDIILIKSGVTNGDVIKALFKPNHVERTDDDVIVENYDFNEDWWHKPYKGDKE